MRKTIMGFDQQRLTELGVKMDEVCILSWIQLAMGSPKMKHIQDKDTGDIYIWLQYKKFLEDFPIISIQEPSLRNKLNKLKSLGLIKQLNVSNESCRGSRVYLAKTELFESLVNTEQVNKNSGGQPDRVNKNSGGQPDRVNKNSGQDTILNTNNKLDKDNTLKDVEQSSTICSSSHSEINQTPLENLRKKYTTDTQQFKGEVQEVIDYLNSVTGKRYNSGTMETIKQIKARLKDGYTVEQMKKVIDSRWSLWKGTDMEQYVRPSTLFRPSNFENYLNNLNIKRKTNNRACPDSQDMLGRPSGQSFQQLKDNEHTSTLCGRKF